MNANIEHTHQFFTFDHLPEPLRSVSARFAAAADAVYADSDCGRAAVKELHAWLLSDLGRLSNLETVMCMRKMHVALNPGLDMAAQYDEDAERELVLRMLLEAKDCAVRATVSERAKATLRDAINNAPPPAAPAAAIKVS
mgnify:CR=1 FL=1